MQRQYLCIDLKSFYTSVECVRRGLDPLTTKLVVADPARGRDAVCLAVSPALKELGVKNRCRLGEIPEQLHFITAPPCMKLYIDRTADIYGIYLKYFSKEDLHVYSVDETFADATGYLSLYGMTAKELAGTVITDIQRSTGLRCACGVGTNLYLAKLALAGQAAHAPDQIGELDETAYRETMWDHRPLTDFWRIGPGMAARLAREGIFTMRDVAMTDERLLYDMFGREAELLIDHAWGRESATIADVKACQSHMKTLHSGQVLMRDCDFEEGLRIVEEMAQTLCLDLTGQDLVTRSLSLTLIYSDKDPLRSAKGRAALAADTNLSERIVPAAAALYRRIGDRRCTLRRVDVRFNDVSPEQNVLTGGVCGGR